MKKRYSIADGLSCRLRNKLMNKKEEDKADIDDFIDVQLNYLQIALIVRNTSLMTFLTVKIFLFNFKNAGRRDIVTEKDKVTEE